MATSESASNGNENGSRSIAGIIELLGTVVWALFALVVAALVATFAWAAVDLGPAVGAADSGLFLGLAAASVLGTALLVAVAIVDA